MFEKFEFFSCANAFIVNSIENMNMIILFMIVNLKQLTLRQALCDN